jgi:hypothetical protein
LPEYPFRPIRLTFYVIPLGPLLVRLALLGAGVAEEAAAG